MTAGCRAFFCRVARQGKPTQSTLSSVLETPALAAAHAAAEASAASRVTGFRELSITTGFAAADGAPRQLAVRLDHQAVGLLTRSAPAAAAAAAIAGAALGAAGTVSGASRLGARHCLRTVATSTADLPSVAAAGAATAGPPGAAAPGGGATGGGAPGRGGGCSTAFLSLPGVDHIVAVSSAKGGVGKSTTAVNLAVALSRHLNLRVGLLDADVYGPSLPKLLGLEGAGKPEVGRGNRMQPLQAYGIKCMSMGFLMGADVAAVWRGPMVMGAVEKMLRGTDWGRLHLLIVDMPPGTGDVQLTISQRAKLSGAVVVSTPQDLALMDARRGVTMFRQVGVEVLGVVENMSYFNCPKCGYQTNVFGHGGARQAAEDMGVDFLAEVPLLPSIRQLSDDGRPVALMGLTDDDDDADCAATGDADGAAAEGSMPAPATLTHTHTSDGTSAEAAASAVAAARVYVDLAEKVWGKLQQQQQQEGKAGETRHAV